VNLPNRLLTARACELFSGDPVRRVWVVQDERSGRFWDGASGWLEAQSVEDFGQVWKTKDTAEAQNQAWLLTSCEMVVDSRALLLQAAPDLLRALQDMVQLHGRPKRDEWLSEPAYAHALQVHKAAVAAIAKAT